MIEINLLPEDKRPRTHVATKKPPVLAPVPRAFPLGLGALTALMVLLVVLSGMRTGSTERKVKRIEHDLKAAKAQAAEAERIIEEFPALADRYTALASRLDGKVNWSEMLRVISLRCPEGVELTAIKLERDRRTGNPSKLVIRGLYSGTGSLEMLFANALKESATFSEMFEAVIPEKELMPDDRTSFAVSCLFRTRTDELVDPADKAREP